VGSLKCELICPGDFASGADLFPALDRYFCFYNHRCPRQAAAQIAATEGLVSRPQTVIRTLVIFDHALTKRCQATAPWILDWSLGNDRFQCLNLNPAVELAPAQVRLLFASHPTAAQFTILIENA